MASGNDNYLIVNCSYGGHNAATNQTLFSWTVHLYVAYSVDARMTGTLDVMDSRGVWIRAQNYSRSYPSGTWSAGNTYEIFRGSAWLSRDAAGGGAFMVSANLYTNTSGSSWSFNKSGSCSTWPPRIVRVPSAPRNLRVQSVTSTSVVLAVDDPADWGNERESLLYRISKNNPPNQAPYLDNQGPGNVATFPTAGAAALSPNTTYYATVYAHNSAGYSGMSPIISFTTGALAPAAPTGIGVALTGTAQAPTHTITWTNRATTSAPYTQVRVQRATRTGLTTWDNWTTIALLAGTANKLVVATAQGPGTRDQAYRYRVGGENAAGTAFVEMPSPGTGFTAPEFPTVPADATNVQASRGTAGSVVVTWSQPTRLNWASQRIDAWNGSQWVTQTTLARTATQWTDTTPYTGITQYRVVTLAQNLPYAWVTASPGALSATLSVQTEPLAPTQLAPSGIAVDLTEDVRFSWRHNPLDGSSQQAFRLRYRLVGTSTWTDVVQVSTGQQWYLPAGTLVNGATYEWQVSTRGVYLGADGSSGWGPWSTLANVTGDSRPIATIVYPMDQSTESVARLTAVWAYFDPENKDQTRWEALLERQTPVGEWYQVESRNGTGMTTQAPFDVLIEDGSTYRLTVVVTDSADVRSLPAVSTFNVVYSPPGYVVLDAAFDRATASIGLSMTPTLWPGPEAPPMEGVVKDVYQDGALGVIGDLDTDEAVLVDGLLDTDEAVLVSGVPQDVEPPSSVDVYRSIDGGPWVLLAEGLSPSASLTDWTPSLEGENCYRLVVWSDLPSTRVEDPAACVRVVGMSHQMGVLSSGDGFSTPLLVECDIDLTTRVEREKETVHLVGRPWPVELSGEALNQVMQVRGTVVGQDAASVRSLLEQAMQEGIVCWRDLVGNRMFASLGALQAGWLVLKRPGIVRVSFELTRIEHYE